MSPYFAPKTSKTPFSPRLTPPKLRRPDQRCLLYPDVADLIRDIMAVAA